jgi:hypothetical protein
MEKWKEDMLNYIFPMDSQYLDTSKGLAIKYKNIPSRLYKYYKFSCNNKSNLEKSVIWLSYPENFNDPYDCALTYSSIDLLNHFYPEEPDDIDNFLKNYNLPDDERTVMRERMVKFSKISINRSTEELDLELIDLTRKTTIISCFCEKNDSIIMWSHYADNHKGFCVEYDFKSLPYSDWITLLLYPVIYQDELLDVTEYMKRKDEHINNLFSARPAITKSKEWEHEKEWRMAMPFSFSKCEMEWNVPLPSSIYAGARIEPENEEYLKQYCTKTKIPLYFSKMNRRMFKIDFEQINI